MHLLPYDEGRWPVCKICNKRVDALWLILDLFEAPEGSKINIVSAYCHGRVHSEVYDPNRKPDKFGIAFGELSMIAPSSLVK
jgi:hypothetical protein